MPPLQLVRPIPFARHVLYLMLGTGSLLACNGSPADTPDAVQTRASSASQSQALQRPTQPTQPTQPTPPTQEAPLLGGDGPSPQSASPASGMKKTETALENTETTRLSQPAVDASREATAWQVPSARPATGHPTPALTRKARAAELVRRLGGRLQSHTHGLQPTRDARGHRVIQLQNGFQHALLARRSPDGTLEYGCVADEASAQHFLEGNAALQANTASASAWQDTEPHAKPNAGHVEPAPE